MARISDEGWSCVTSRFTVLEMLDFEQEEEYVSMLRDQGLLLSQVRGLLGDRSQVGKGLHKRQFDSIYDQLHDGLKTRYPFLQFVHPLRGDFWDKAEEFCAGTSIGAANAIHLAALIMECDIVVTRDNDFRQIADDYIVAILPEAIESALARLNSY